jgi:hypothetical protein
MTTPLEPPTTVGTQPPDANALNNQIGLHLRSFLGVKNTINQDRDFLAATDLKVAPYGFTADQETLVKSAILGLDTALDGVDMTFIVRLIGLG